MGIAALFAYNWLVARINKIMNMLEARTMDFMDLPQRARIMALKRQQEMLATFSVALE